MQYTFHYYRENDYPELLALVLDAYKWCHPFCGLSRLEFCKGYTPQEPGRAWTRSVALYRDAGKLAACVWNEGPSDGERLFLFDSRKRAEDAALLREMLRFVKTFSSHTNDGKNRHAKLTVPDWHHTLKKLAVEEKFAPSGEFDRYHILPFAETEFDVRLPEGYRFAHGGDTPDFYLSNVHQAAFAYEDQQAEKVFHNVRGMARYKKEFDLCVLDPMGRPVAMSILWYDPSMPYCELEPLGAVWWERRKGISTALLHEAANRMKRAYPQCRGMLGGDQPFYRAIGYKEEAAAEFYNWSLEVPISWDRESADRRFFAEL